MQTKNEILRTPCRDDLNLKLISNKTGLTFSLLPSGMVYAIEAVKDGRTTMINQSYALPIEGGMGGIVLRISGHKPKTVPIVGTRARCSIGSSGNQFVWEGKEGDIKHRVCLSLDPDINLWLWRVEVINSGESELSCDSIFIQDLGLGDPGFLMNNEAYASQYIDHHIAHHPRMKIILMARQNQAQGGAYPWVAHGCIEGAVGFATDFRQLMGDDLRNVDFVGGVFGVNLPSERLQYETACAALQSKPVSLAPGATACWTFFGLYQPDHAAASSQEDLKSIDSIEELLQKFAPVSVDLSLPMFSILHEANAAIAEPLDASVINAYYPNRLHEENVDGKLLSFFTPNTSYQRHIVLRDKERLVARRHGALLRTGQGVLPDETTLCSTCWMHGVFSAQLTIGNTSFHKLFSVSRDPYNITRASGLRMLVELKEGWRLLSVPSAFEIGLNDSRWIYKFSDRTICISVTASSEDSALQWRISVEGESCRFLIFGHIVLGEREYGQAANIEIDNVNKRFSFTPAADTIWGQHYPQASYHLVTSTADRVESIGGDELLYVEGKQRSGAYAVIRTSKITEFVFAVVGSMTDALHAKELANKYTKTMEEKHLLRLADTYWRNITRGAQIKTSSSDAQIRAEAASLNTMLPWLAHDAIIHVTVPHGLEQYTGAAWGTRDVCQGPVELFLSFEHDQPVKQILRIIFAQQYEKQGDWPQWFMLEPYSFIQDKSSHGDIIVWPLKALCDYIEATGDFDFLDEEIAWRREDNFEKTERLDSIATHIETLIATVKDRFIAGTYLIRYGNGDWNDALQPVDVTKRDWMVSSWTVALLYQQICRYAIILQRKGMEYEAEELKLLAANIRNDFNRYLMRDGTVAGYGVFKPDGGAPDLLIHPSDTHTGVCYSLIPMTQAILGELFTPEQSRHHLDLIREHLLFVDGARLMDKPIAYNGGLEKIFKRAESSAFFGREIGLMYTHSHLRYCEAMSVLNESQALRTALLTVNPISVTEILPTASLRQRNTYFSSSDAAFRDRYQASDEWERVKNNSIFFNGGWRIYSSGPGVYINILIQQALGARRYFGERLLKPSLPTSLGINLEWPERHDGAEQKP